MGTGAWNFWRHWAVTYIPNLETRGNDSKGLLEWCMHGQPWYVTYGRNRICVRLCYIIIMSSLYFQQKQIEKGRIIIYTTSFSGVRGTHEDCKYILSLFYNHRVRVEERDVYMNQSYHHELDERLRGDDCTLPQVFINGEHIGVRFFIIYTPFFFTLLSYFRIRIELMN